MTDTKTIFISHSTKDDSAIDRIADVLESAGHTIWVDHRNGIIPGEKSWDKAIRTAIKDADVGVFVMSENALASDICGAECILVRELEKPLYVLRLESCAPENIFLYIKQIQYADLVTDFDAGMKAFLEALGGATDDHLPTSARAKVTGSETMRAYLPFLANPLRGRDDDVAHIQALLPQAGVTQIIGVGGWGKSRISAEIALAYPDGAVWHRCSSVSGTGDIFALLRQHFDLPADIPQENIFTLLERNHPLVVIDNGEDITPQSERRADYVAVLGKIIATGTPLILTSRTVWDELKPRKQYPPPALHETIARQITADFAESQAIPLTSDQIAELTRASRNHPRMIELAVGLLQDALPYDRLIKRLNDLTHDDMQEALNEMIRKTVDQMRHEAKHGADAHALLHRLTWLVASFPYEAIVALKPPDMTEDALDDAIITLGRYTLLQHDKQTGRYRLGSLVREALGIPDDEVLFNAYADFYIGRAKAIFVDLEDTPELWKDFDDDIVNITALGNELAGQTEINNIDFERFLMFIHAVKGYVTLYIEMRLWSWLETAIHHLKQSASQSEPIKKLEADILCELGNIYLLIGENQQALEMLEQALSFYRLVEDKISENKTIRLIGNVWYILGNKPLALKFFQQALSLSQEIADKKGEARALNNIGLALFDLRDVQKSLIYYENALSMLRELGDKKGVGATLNNIGLLLSTTHENDRAIEYYKSALELRRMVGDRAGEATTLNNIGKSLAYLGDKDQALTYCEEALSLSRLVGDKVNEARTLINLGDIWLQLENNGRVLIYYNQALSLNRLVGDSGNEAITLARLSNLYRQQNNLDEAIIYIERAIVTTYEGDPHISEWQKILAYLKSERDAGGG